MRRRELITIIGATGQRGSSPRALNPQVRKLGLTVPPAMLALATQAIE
jgi:hypothetical protein